MVETEYDKYEDLHKVLDSQPLQKGIEHEKLILDTDET